MMIQYERKAMALVIRLTKTGRKGEARFRIVVAEKRSRLAGKPIETLGWLIKGVKNTKKVNLSQERYNYWITQGAKPSQPVANLL